MSPDGRYLAYADPTGIKILQTASGETDHVPATRGMSVYAWTADSTKVRASECDATECVGWDISLVGGARFRSGTNWPASQTVWPMRDGSRVLRLTEAGLQLDLLNGAPARVLAPAARTASLTADGRRVLFTTDGSALRSLSIETGRSETVFTPENKQRITEAMELADHRVLVLLRVRTTVAIKAPVQRCGYGNCRPTPRDGRSVRLARSRSSTRTSAI